MGISIASLITVAIICYCIVKNNRYGINSIFRELLLFTVFVSIFISTGSFIQIGTVSIGYDTAVSSVLFLFAIVVLIANKQKTDKKLSILAFLLIICLVFGILLLLVNPFKGQIIHNISDWDGYVLGNVEKDNGVWVDFSETFLLLFAFIRMVVIFCAASKCFTKTDDFNVVLNKSIRISDIIILYGYAELVLKYIFNISLTEIFLFTFFGESETYVGTDRLIGFTKEASQYATSLFLLVILYVLKIQNDRINGLKNASRIYMRFILAMILLIFSTSFSAFYYLILICLLIIVTCLNSKWRFIVTGMILLAVVLLAFTMQSEIIGRLERTLTVICQLFNGGNVLPTSEGARLTSIFDSIFVFLKRPMFGVGLGTTDAHSTLVSMLANCGLSGFLLWLLFLIRLNFKGRRNTKWLIFIILLSMLYLGGIGYAAKVYYPFVIMLSAGLSANGKANSYRNGYVKQRESVIKRQISIV